MGNVKKLISCILAVFLLVSFSACNNKKDNLKTISTENNSSFEIPKDEADNIISSSSQNEASDLKNSATCLLSAKDYQNFLEEQLLSNNNWQLESNGENTKEYYDGKNGYLRMEICVDSCMIQSNGYALGIETPEMLFEADYHSAQASDFRIYVYSGISMEHCAAFALKIFEDSPAKITIDEFLMHYNGGEAIDPSKIEKKAMVINGVEYIVEVKPVYTLDGELLSTSYSIDASFAK